MLAALLLAGTIFVLGQRDEEEQAALDRRAASLNTVINRTSQLQQQGVTEDDLADFVNQLAEEEDVRLVLVDPGGTVIEDSDGTLAGEQIETAEQADEPAAVHADGFRRGDGHGFPLRTFRSVAEGELILIGPSGFGPGSIEEDQSDTYSVLIAVKESTITNAWLGLLPGLAIAAAIALPVVVLVAAILARQITRPLRQLTLASEQIAEGHFDVEVPRGGGDEVGVLSASFSAMAARVGETQRQMRMLIADVSHDLRTPLTSILGFSKALRDGDAPSQDTARIGGVIHDEAARLSGRLGDLLYLSELESGQAILDRSEIDFDALVLATLQRLGRSRGESRDISDRLDSGAMLSGDWQKLERAIENLVDNALRYSPPRAEIEVGTRLDGPRVVLDIGNPAPDLAEDEVPRLFERFYRGGRSRDAGESGRTGSGLGLPIARDLVELHGGTLDGRLERGMLTLSMRLPVAPN
jgi:signal transduction histidine kinase